MKKFLILLLALLCLAIPAMAENRVIDNANLLSSKEESALESTIQKIADEYQMDVVILLENSISKAPRYYAADFYDYGGYGYGDSHDGILFLLNMGERDYFTLTTGRAISAITDYGREQMEERFVPYLSSGNYYLALTLYLDMAEDLFAQAQSGRPYDVGNPLYVDESGNFYAPSALEMANQVFPIVLIIALVAALITVFIMKGQMKTIWRKAGAASYVKEGSFQLTRQQDIYLYTTTRRRKIETNSSGGSSTFRGSSGRSHGGGGGKF